jgi:hypothetical protein
MLEEVLLQALHELGIGRTLHIGEHIKFDQRFDIKMSVWTVKPTLQAYGVTLVWDVNHHYGRLIIICRMYRRLGIEGRKDTQTLLQKRLTICTHDDHRGGCCCYTYYVAKAAHNLYP